ncbi:MAG: hypothetical protein GXY48_11050 [Methanomicrobiales archaeon]|nr:hypothetical protein [Methanomicrobiales archaeon]
MKNSEFFSPAGFDTLKNLHNSYDYSIDAVIIGSDGKNVSIYPQSYNYLIGENISNRSYVVKGFTEKKPVMSDVFLTFEGFPAIDQNYPDFSLNNLFQGMISLLIGQTEMFRYAIYQADPERKFEIFIIETDGDIVYDVNTTQIGHNLFTDPMFIDHPSIVELVRIISNSTNGTGSYEYYNSSGVLIQKDAVWGTVSQYEKEWRIVVAENR